MGEIEVTKATGHESLKSGWSILQPKWNSVGLKQSHGSAERSLVSIMLCHFHLPVTRCEVEGGEVLCLSQSLQGFLYPWQKECVSCAAGVELSLVDT